MFSGWILISTRVCGIQKLLEKQIFLEKNQLFQTMKLLTVRILSQFYLLTLRRRRQRWGTSSPRCPHLAKSSIITESRRFVV